MREKDFISTIEWLRGQSRQAGVLNKDIERRQDSADQIDFKIEETIKTLVFLYGEEISDDLERVIHMDREESAEELYSKIINK